jgi:hypothetical protein
VTATTELVSTNDVYVRSLSHNNTPSTGMPRWDTWEKILDPLFENREADLMDLLRRYALTMGICIRRTRQRCPERSPDKAFLDSLILGNTANGGQG